MIDFIKKIKKIIFRLPIFYRMVTIFILIALVMNIFQTIFSSINNYIADKKETLLVIMKENDEYINSINKEIDKIYSDYTYKWTPVDPSYPDKINKFQDYYDSLLMNLDKISNKIEYAIYSDKVPQDKIHILESINEELSVLIESISVKSDKMNELAKINTEDDVSQIINQTNILLNITSFYEEDYNKIKDNLTDLEKELNSLNINIAKFNDKKPKQIGIRYKLLNKEEIEDIKNIREYISEKESYYTKVYMDLLGAISKSNVDEIHESSAIAYNLAREIGMSLEDYKDNRDFVTKRGDEYISLLIQYYYNLFKNLQKLINNDLPELIYRYGPTGNGDININTISLMDSLNLSDESKEISNKISMYDKLCQYLRTINIVNLNNINNDKSTISENNIDTEEDIDKQKKAYKEVCSISNSGDTVELFDENYIRDGIEYYMYMIIDKYDTSGDMMYIVEKETLELFVIYPDGTIYSKSEFLNDNSN